MKQLHVLMNHYALKSQQLVNAYLVRYDLKLISECI